MSHSERFRNDIVNSGGSHGETLTTLDDGTTNQQAPDGFGAKPVFEECVIESRCGFLGQHVRLCNALGPAERRGKFTRHLARQRAGNGPDGVQQFRRFHVESEGQHFNLDVRVFRVNGLNQPCPLVLIVHVEVVNGQALPGEGVIDGGDKLGGEFLGRWLVLTCWLHCVSPVRVPVSLPSTPAPMPVFRVYPSFR